jgi:cold shock CspA family protein
MKRLERDFDPLRLGFQRLSDLLGACGSVETRRDERGNVFAKSRLDPAEGSIELKCLVGERSALLAEPSENSPCSGNSKSAVSGTPTEPTGGTDCVQRGVVARLVNEKNFGFIKNETTGEEAFFHFSAVENSSLGLPIPGDVVSYTSRAGEKGIVASQVKLSWHYGIVVRFVADRGFGFIKSSDQNEDLFFHRDELGDTNLFPCDPFPGNYVVFSQITKGPRGLGASNVNRITPSVGVVEKWNRIKGEGTIRLEGSEITVPVTWRDICSRDAIMDVGWSVSLIVSDTTSTPFASCVQKELPLRRFARIRDETRMLEDLAGKVLPGENWEYRDSHTYSRFPILESYLFYTFQRLEEEDAGKPPEKRKIKIASTREGIEKAAFNTGLVDHTYRPIFAGFSRNTIRVPGEPLWTFECFVARGEIVRGRSYMSIFPDLPERAEYFTDPRDVVYDTTLRLDAVTDHIVGDRCSRLPRKLRERVPEDMTNPGDVQSFLADYLRMAIERALERIKWNYKTAVPQYFFSQHRMQLLLPLCIEDPRRVDLAIAVERDGGAYVGRTILELDWAYNNARLIARPDSDWLTPNTIQRIEEELDSGSEQEAGR